MPSSAKFDIENWLKVSDRKNYFSANEIFSGIFISKMGVIMFLRVITKKHEVFPEIGFPTKSILGRFLLSSPFRRRGS